jgi:large subunit ribosomal protein L20
MTRKTNAPASRRSRKRWLKRAKGFVGDRKNHIRLTKDAVMKAMAYQYIHRKDLKGNMRNIWVVRIGTAAKMNGISYSKFINGLKKANCSIDRKMLANLAIKDPNAFAFIVEHAKKALAA